MKLAKKTPIKRNDGQPKFSKIIAFSLFVSRKKISCQDATYLYLWNSIMY